MVPVSFIAFQCSLHGPYDVRRPAVCSASSAAQADLDRLHGETSYCEALFAYSTNQKYISSVFTRGHHLSSMFTVPQLYYLLRQAVYRMHALIDVYIRLWHTHNTIERRIYTPLAVDVLNFAD